MKRLSAFAVLLVSGLVIGLLAEARLAADDHFVSIFDGKSLEGWKGEEGVWSVRDGAIVGSSLPDGIRHNTFLVSDGSYENFVLRLKFKLLSERGNSGIQFRSKPAGGRSVSGYQADIGPGYWGDLYDEHRRNRALVKADGAWVAPFIRKDRWNTYEIRAIGKHITLKINELVTARYSEKDDDIARDGIIALQIHSGPGMEIAFKDIQVRAIKPKRVLYTTHAAGFAHSSRPVSREVIEKLGRDSGWFEAVVTDGVEMINPEDLEGFDCVGFYTTGDLNKFPLSKENREHLIEWVKRGKAFFGTHSATDTYKDWEPYWEMIGGSFAGHPWNAGSPPVTIDVEDPSHPSVHHLDSQWVIQDEIYQFRNWSRDRVHVILSLNPKEHAKGSRPHGDYPVAWCRDYGDGKVFYTSLGHREDVWTNPVYQEHLLRGILWALGIEGHEGDATPGRPKPSNEWVDLLAGGIDDWKRTRRGTWKLEDGVLSGSGHQGHLFAPGIYRNFHYRADAKVGDDSNSGMYFRTRYDAEVSWPRGMEAQVNSTHGDRKRTGTLYGYEDVYEQLAKPYEWFTQEVIAVGEHIVIKVNGRVTVSRRVPFDERKHFREGHFAFQQHHEGSEVWYRNVRVRPLP